MLESWQEKLNRILKEHKDEESRRLQALKAAEAAANTLYHVAVHPAFRAFAQSWNDPGEGRLAIEDFARQLGEFSTLTVQWKGEAIFHIQAKIAATLDGAILTVQTAEGKHAVNFKPVQIYGQTGVTTGNLTKESLLDFLVQRVGETLKTRLPG